MAAPNGTPAHRPPTERRIVLIAAGVVLSLAASAVQEMLEDSVVVTTPNPSVAPAPTPATVPPTVCPQG